MTLWTIAHQGPLPQGFSRQEYWSGLPCPPPGDLPDPGIEPVPIMSPALAGRFFTTSATWEACENSEKSVICSLEERYWQSDLGSPASGTERNKCLLFRSHLNFPGGSDGKASACNAGHLGSIPGLGRSPGEENGNPPQYSCLENPMDRGAWWAMVHGVAKSWTRQKQLSPQHTLVNIFSLPYNFLHYFLACFVVRIQSVIHITYKICGNGLFMLSIRLPVSSTYYY